MRLRFFSMYFFNWKIECHLFCFIFLGRNFLNWTKICQNNYNLILSPFLFVYAASITWNRNLKVCISSPVKPELHLNSLLWRHDGPGTGVTSHYLVFPDPTLPRLETAHSPEIARLNLTSLLYWQSSPQDGHTSTMVAHPSGRHLRSDDNTGSFILH